MELADPCQQNHECIYEFSAEKHLSEVPEISFFMTCYPRIDKLSVDLMSDCYHVRDIHTEVAYFFPGSEVRGTFPSLSETLTFAGYFAIPQKE